ncbi:MAG: ATP-binding protein [Atopobiaceae bacterium]|nr:ATP-binding protein [Atopobiaceae bacterium]
MRNALESDLLTFVSSFEGGDGLRVEESLGGGFVRLRVSEAERRQAKHDIRCVEDAVIELLRNARDAGARHIFVSTSREGDLRTVCVVDDGAGIPQNMHRRVFDARVTSKLDTMRMDKWGVHGRGMALYSIAQNAVEARVVQSDVGLGTALTTTFDVSDIVERADQSTWPTVERTGSGYEVRGPRNVLRACVEFSLEAEGLCNVYVGSASEAVAAMRARMDRPLVDAGWVYPDDLAAIPLAQRAVIARDARELAGIAGSLGLEMSERTAHRIVKRQIAAPKNVRAKLLGTSAARVAGKPGHAGRQLSLSREDRDEFLERLEQDFAWLAQRYYVVPNGRPRLRVGKESIRVTFDFVDDE